jgi:hypothetical protein
VKVEDHSGKDGCKAEYTERYEGLPLFKYEALEHDRNIRLAHIHRHPQLSVLQAKSGTSVGERASHQTKHHSIEGLPPSETSLH